eukprot:s11027_g1.t1
MIEHSLSEVNVSPPTGSSPRCVAELTKKEAAYTRKYAELTQWEDMRWPLRAGILLSSLVILIVSWFLGADFALSTQICFRTFSITDRPLASCR